MADLDFVKDDRGHDLRGTGYFSGPQKFWDLRNHEIPAGAGAYVLLARGTRFQYPIGNNAVYYIGQSTSLRKRLGIHLRRAEGARRRAKRLSNREWPRYEYAASFGTHYCYIETWAAAETTSTRGDSDGAFPNAASQFPGSKWCGFMEPHRQVHQTTSRRFRWSVMVGAAIIGVDSRWHQWLVAVYVRSVRCSRANGLQSGNRRCIDVGCDRVGCFGANSSAWAEAGSAT